MGWHPLACQTENKHKVILNKIYVIIENNRKDKTQHKLSTLTLLAG